jgi:hypothetical protein
MAVLGVLGLAFWLYVRTPATVDHFNFLEGRRPVDVNVARNLYGDDDSPGSEYRFYSWRTNPTDVMAIAGRELVSRGYHLTSTDRTGKFWRKDASLVGVTAERVVKIPAIVGTTPDPGWTTVGSVNELPDSLRTNVRLIFEPRF